MTDLTNKVAVVTGASSGIGAEIVKVLLGSGVKVVGVARRIERVEELGEDYQGKLFAIKADVNKGEDVQNVVHWTETHVGPVDVLINGAGISILDPIDDASPEDIATILNTNLLATTLFTREAIRSMKANKVDGTIINICSIAGHYIVPMAGLSVYYASKFGVRAFTESIRGELAQSGSKIRITNLSPGLVYSEMTANVAKLLEENVYLQSKDIADAVTYILTVPQNINISELTIRPTGEKL